MSVLLNVPIIINNNNNNDNDNNNNNNNTDTTTTNTTTTTAAAAAAASAATTTTTTTTTTTNNNNNDTKRFLFTHVVKSPARPIFRVIEFDLQSSHGSNIFGNYREVVNTESGRFIRTLFYSYF